MLDKQDLQAIRGLMKEELSQSRQEIMQEVSVLMESDFRPQFNLLAENQQTILEKLSPLDDLELLSARVSVLEAAVKKLNKELAQLKKAE